MIKQLEDMWQYAQCVADEEDQDPKLPEFKKHDPEKIQLAADKINRIFAQLQHNRNFKRFTLKGIEKVEIAFGLHALAHNLKKMSA
ncbi:transposase [Vaginella massiliensis]|uniref:transposase n=1 Tax=Vaginella massiliensis TaxID=1816680 RepID=UPI003750013D